MIITGAAITPPTADASVLDSLPVGRQPSTAGAQILSYPFRLTPTGHAVTVEQGSEQGNAEQIGVLLLTELGERTLLPSFGITDPTYAGIEPTEVIAGITEHGPDVTVGDIRPQWDSDSTQLVHIDFE